MKEILFLNQQFKKMIKNLNVDNFIEAKGNPLKSIKKDICGLWINMWIKRSR
jgi:hypothetical protein